MRESSISGFQEMKFNSEPKDVPHPEDFPLGSPASRAAARLLLKRWNDSHKWLTFGYCEPRPGDDSSKVHFRPWKELPDGDLMRMVYIPSAWRILPACGANVADNDVPSCCECGASFVEEGRYGIIVRFVASCLDRHDPSPPPKRTRPDPMSVNRLSEVDIEAEQQVCVKMWAYELEEFLAERLNIPKGHIGNFISGQSEADAGLRARIAAELE